MELFEKINRAFGTWYEGLFGGNEDVRPKDILRKILTAMEEHRKEGFDSKIYVPNQYILEIAVDDEEEREYLLSFLDRDELETAIRRYCEQNRYQVRGGLDFTIKEVEMGEEGRKRDKVRVRCRYDSKLAAEKPAPPIPASEPVSDAPAVHADEATVYEEFGDSDLGTVPAVAAARLAIASPGRPTVDFPLVRGSITIGRSTRAGNDLVLDQDGMVSRRHARVEMESDGRFTIYDLDTTNGTRVNGRRIDNHALSNNDEILIGSTRITFHQNDAESSRSVSHLAAASSLNGSRSRIIVLDGDCEVKEFVLGSDTVIGRAVTNDIVLPERAVATRHVRIRRGEPFTIEALDKGATTLLNGAPMDWSVPTPLRSGDRIGIGPVALRFEDSEK